MPVEVDAFYRIDHRLIALVMVALLLAACEIGYRLGLARQSAPDSLRTLMTGIGGAMLGLLGLLLGFALTMAISRWDERRDIIIEEANAIGTLSLRAGLLEEPLGGQLREALRAYTKARVALGGSRDRPGVLHTALGESEDIHAVIWSVVERSNVPSVTNAALASLISSANELIDLHELRLASLQNQLPSALFYLLIPLAALSVAHRSLIANSPGSRISASSALRIRTAKTSLRLEIYGNNNTSPCMDWIRYSGDHHNRCYEAWSVNQSVFIDERYIRHGEKNHARRCCC